MQIDKFKLPLCLILCSHSCSWDKSPTKGLKRYTKIPKMQSKKLRLCMDKDRSITIICLIIICPRVIYLYPSPENLRVESAVNSCLWFSLLTFQIISWKAKRWSPKRFGKFIFWTFTYTAISQLTHTIIRPKRAVTPQLNLQPLDIDQVGKSPFDLSFGLIL